MSELKTVEELRDQIERIKSALAELQPQLGEAFQEVEVAENMIAEKIAADNDMTSMEDMPEDHEAMMSLRESEGKVDELSEKIKTLQDEAEAAYTKYKLLKPMDFKDIKSIQDDNGNVDTSQLEEMLKGLEAKSMRTNKNKKTVGRYIADYLEGLNVKSSDDFQSVFQNKLVPFQFNFDESDTEAVKEIEKLDSIKSLYINGGTEVLDGGNPVPGFQGYGCAIWEVDDECQLCCEPRTFGDCLTIRNMPGGSAVQYDYPVSRDDQAGAVLENIYNPYPTKVQDGIKPEGTFTYNTAKVNVVKIAEYITASDEVLEDCSKVADRIDFFLESSLLRERDRQLIAGDGTNGQMVGLLNQPGLLTLDGNTLATGITNANIWDKLYLADLELQQNCAQVDCVLVNPADRAKVALAKDADGNYLFPQDACDVEGVGCFMIRTSPDVPVGTAIMGEFRDNWIMYLRKNLTVRVGMTGDQFIHNSRTFLAELRGANVVLCPQKIAVVTNI